MNYLKSFIFKFKIKNKRAGIKFAVLLATYSCVTGTIWANSQTATHEAHPAEETKKSDAHSVEAHSGNNHASGEHEKNDHKTPAHESVEQKVTQQEATEHSSSEQVVEVAPEKNCSFFQKVIDTFKSMHHKVQQLYSMEYENDRLKYENTALRIALEQEKLAASTQKVKQVADSNAKEIRKETKHEAGRLLASIKEEIPTNLNDDEMFALASSYFRNRYDEKAAAILLKLIDLDEEAKFETAQTYLMLAVSFFRLKNDQACLKFLDKAEGMTKAQRVKNQIDLWRAAVYQRQGDGRLAQDKMHAVLNRNPKSQEARWVNPTGGEDHAVRTPASDHP